MLAILKMFIQIFHQFICTLTKKKFTFTSQGDFQFLSDDP